MTASLRPDLSPAQARAPMSFSGRGREFLKLLIAGCLFQIPTFGFYRFWLVTKLRRHLWSNTQVAGEAFEYTGTAKELLIGFLIAIAILIPIYLGYFILGMMLEEKKALASLPLLLVMYALMHFASYRARRYRATRTVFRGIRFWMTGAGWAYAGRAILWDIAIVLTLGLALPWAMASLERYRMRHTYFGTIQGDFAGTGWTLFRRGTWVWALGLALGIGVPVTAVAVAGPYVPADVLEALGLIFIALLIVGLLPVAMAIFTRWQLEGIRFGALTVSSDLRKRAFYGPFLKMVFSFVALALCVSVALAAGAVLFGDRVKALQTDEPTWETGGVVALAALAYLVLLLSVGVIRRYFMGRGLWAVTVGSLTVANLQTIEAAVAAGQPSGAMGEGLADALQLDVGI